MRAIDYAIREAMASLVRAGRSAAMSLGTITIAFLTLGGFLLLSTNLQSLIDVWESAAEMSVYLREDLSEADRQALVDELSAHPAVAGVELLSRDQALERFKADFPELADLTAAGDTNPFPGSIEVRVEAGAAAAPGAETLASQLAERDGVADVQYDRHWLSRLAGLATSVRLVGLIVGGVLLVGAAFTVAAVVRLSLDARRGELDIMDLVGAPLAFTRGPFVAEGIVLGGLGALVSIIALWSLFRVFRPQLTEGLTGLATIGELRFLSAPEATLLVAAGLVMGGLAGALASRVAR
jgi:cell division transport system permease protein